MKDASFWTVRFLCVRRVVSCLLFQRTVAKRMLDAVAKNAMIAQVLFMFKGQLLVQAPRDLTTDMGCLGRLVGVL